MSLYESIAGIMLYQTWTLWAIVGVSFAFLFIGYIGAPFMAWVLLGLIAMVGFGAPLIATATVFAISLLFLLKPLRRVLISRPIMKALKGILPKISETERTALEAGVIWSEAELFSGRPNAEKLFNHPFPSLSPEEKAFMDGPVKELCQMIDDWKIWKTRSITPEVFQFLKEKKFLGMIIPKEYGGLGFSNFAHSEVIQMLSTRSITTSITVMVPNSLGPAELLIHYGTDAQKERYLPRLATGEEIPCFGLTEPAAGSDAGALTSEGVLFKGDDGKIYIRLNWRKRWITLAAISTVIGLAFRLRDPDNLLGKGEDLGITCALIPSNTAGVVVGRRHDPLAVPFYNCPTEGKNVVVNAEECIIGGLANSGAGWTMLMESLAAGRGISLPAQSTGGAKIAARVAGNHSLIRKQFGVSIGKFEGVEEPLSRIGGTAYFTEAVRLYTLSALDQGVKPPVVTAMAKYNTTEWFRRSINDAMDILGGAGISMGPRNLIAIPYIAAPISITVEGANILTRTLIVFGQGALRAHPFAYKEVKAAESGDLKGFDQAFWGHIGHISRNLFRSVLLSVTRGYIAPRRGGELGRYYQKLCWSSASFAIMADMAMGLLGGELKFKEKITGRFADILSWMYTATAVMYRYEQEGRRKQDLPLVQYSLDYAFSEIQRSFSGLFANFDLPRPMNLVAGWFFKGPIRWWAEMNSIAHYPSDRLGHKVADLLMTHRDVRDNLTKGIYLPKDPAEAMGRSEKAFSLVLDAENIVKKIKHAIKGKKLPKKRIQDVLDLAVNGGVITMAEKDIIAEAEKWRTDAIQVDDYGPADYAESKASSVSSVTPGPQRTVHG